MIIDNDFMHKQCPFCGADSIGKLGDIAYSLPLVFSSEEITLKNIPELWTCRKCNSGFTQFAIPENAAAMLYESGAGSKRWISKPFVDEKPREVVRLLKKIFLPGRHILDVGCNTGELLDYAQSCGCFTTGVEYSRASMDVVKAKGHKVIKSIYDTDDCFDVISAFDLVEHLYDIPLFLSICHNKLKDDGVLVVLTGNITSLSAQMARANWWYVSYPEHIMFPSKNYIYSVPQFSVASWVTTYASTKFYSPLKGKLLSFLKGMHHGNYSALPSLGPDHVLVVLKKCKSA